MKNLERDNTLLWKQLTRLNGQCMEQKAILQQMSSGTSEDSEDGGNLTNQGKDDELKPVSNHDDESETEPEEEETEKQVTKIELYAADVMKMKEMIKAKVEEIIKIKKNKSDSEQESANENQNESILNDGKDEIVEFLELSDSSSSKGNDEMEVSEEDKGESILSGDKDEMVVTKLELNDSSCSNDNEEMDVSEKECSVLETSELSNLLECQLEEEETPSTEWAEKLQRWQKPSSPTYPEIESRFAVNKIPAGDAVFTNEEFFNLRIFYPPFYKKLSFSFHELKGGSAKERNLHDLALIRVLDSGGFITNPVCWLMKKKLGKAVTVCPDCSGKKLQMIKTPAYFDHTAFCCLSTKCKRVVPFVRPPFFDRYRHPLSTLLVVVYHWVSQSEFSVLLKDSQISSHELILLYKDIQFICSVEVENHDRNKIVMPNEILEVSAFQYGPYVIVAAMSKNRVVVRFKVVPCNTSDLKDELLKAAASFVHPNNRVLSDCNIFSDLKLYCLGFELARYPLGNCQTLKKFIKTHLQCHLEKFSPVYFCLDTLQGILNELEWRQRFCHMTSMNCYDSAFWAILQSLCCKNIVKGVAPHLFKREVIPRERIQNKERIDLTVFYPNEKVAAAACTSYNNEMAATTLTMLESEGFSRAMVPLGTVVSGITTSYTYSSALNGVIWNVMCIEEGGAPFTVTGLLSVKTWPLVSRLMNIIKNSVQSVSFDACAWRENLAQEDFFLNPVKWLVKNHFAPGNTFCDTCKGAASCYDTDESEFFKCKHRCAKVSKQPFKRPKFYTWFSFPMRDVLKLLYHWASQSPVGVIQEHVRLSAGEIRYLFWVVQKHCSSILEQSPKFGNKCHVIEVGLIQYGKFCILGAFNRHTKDVRLKVLYAREVYSSSMFEPVLKEWLGPCTLVVTSLPGFNLNNYVVVHVKEQNHETSYIHIDKYLISLVHGLFANFRTVEVNSTIIQSYIDEVVWRQTYGSTPEKAFLSLLSQLSYDNVTGYDELIQKNAFSTAETAPQVLNQTPFSLKPCVSNDEESNRKRPSDTDLNLPVSQKNVKISGCDELIQNNSFSTAEAAPQVLNQASFSLKPCVSNDEESNQKQPSDTNLILPVSQKNIEISGDSDSHCAEIKREPSPELVSPESESPNDDKTTSVVEIMGETDSSEDSNKNRLRLWTLKKSNARLLKPFLEDAFSVFKREKKEKKKCYIADGKYVAVDELYFAELEVQKNPSHTPVFYLYNCNLCKFFMYGNILAMGHALEHAAEEQKKNGSDIYFCEHCFLEFDSEEELTYHITEVHVQMNSLACLICSELCFSSEDLISHMQKHHVPCEMPYSCPACPYRSSLHKDVLRHFRLTHQFEPHLVCPYCLKMCSPHTKTQEILNINVYCKHVLKHKTVNSNLKCPSCCLLFFSEKEVLSHKMKEHRSFIDSKDSVPFIPRQNPSVIVMKNTVPFSQYPQAPTVSVKPTKLTHGNQQYQTKEMQPVRPTAKITSLPVNLQPNAKNLLQPYTLSEQCNSSSNNVMLIQSLPARTEVEYEHGELSKVEKPSRCLECGNPVDDNHFFKLLNCTCKYSTWCSKAFTHHMVKKHSVLKDKAPSVLLISPAVLQKRASCSCSFSSKNGDILASHLKTCRGIIKVIDSNFTVPKQKGSSRHVQLHQFSSSKLSVSGVCVKVNDALNSAVDSSQMPYLFDGDPQMTALNNSVAYYSGQMDNASVNCMGVPVCIPVNAGDATTQGIPGVQVQNSYSLTSDGQVVYSYSYPQMYHSAMDNNLIAYGTAIDPSATPSFCYMAPTNDVVTLPVIPQNYSEQNADSACKIEASGSQLPFQIVGSSSLAQNTFPKSSAFVYPPVL